MPLVKSYFDFVPTHLYTDTAVRTYIGTLLSVQSGQKGRRGCEVGYHCRICCGFDYNFFDAVFIGQFFSCETDSPDVNQSELKNKTCHKTCHRWQSAGKHDH